MRIAIGSDHIGFAQKGVLVAALEDDGHVVLDLGTFSDEPVDFPDYARVVGQAVLRGFVDAGVLVCGSAVGAAMAANKVRAVRAAACADAAAARESREQLDANVLCLPAILGDDDAIAIAFAWVGAAFSEDEVHARHVSKLTQLDAGPPPERDKGRAPSAGGRAVRGGPAVEAPRKPAAAGAPAPVAPVEPLVAARVVTPPAATEPPADPAPAGQRVPQPVDASVHAIDARATAAAEPAEASGAPTGLTARRAIRDALGLPVTEETLGFLESQEFLDRLWVKDASLWRGDAKAVEDRLGWLTSPTLMRGHVDELKRFADEVRRLNFSQIVLLGAGGSSIAGHVLADMFPARMGFPDLFTLDSTDPGAVKQTLDSVTLTRTLFVVSSKSGTAPETLAAYSYFRRRVEAAGPKPGLQFIAITDPGTPLEHLAAEAGFRRTFLNAPSIGSRYAALSFFGLVPAALAGVDVKALLERAQAMVERCGNSGGARDNPGVRLGAALAGLARAGRDKITLLLSEPIKALGPWIEHLLAASLGKDGKGLVPVVDEPLGNPVVYGGDRVFVAITLDGDAQFDDILHALDEAGHPVIRIGIKDALDIGGEFFRWQMATATAAAALGVNPFDEPDVLRVQDKTAGLLAAWRAKRHLPEWPVAVAEDGVALLSRSSAPIESVGEGLATHLAQAEAHDYVALLAYLPPSSDYWSRLQALRLLLRDRLRIATTLDFGPQYLHGAGQLHKGGRPNGLLIQIVGEDREDVAIPGADYSFSTLKAAQSLADLETLRESGRRVICLRLAGRPDQGLQQLLQIARAATRRL